VSGSGHLIPYEAPDVVVDAARQVVNELRRDSAATASPAARDRARP
jgi:hypothetical protein